jgi:hypothetical protein
VFKFRPKNLSAFKDLVTKIEAISHADTPTANGIAGQLAALAQFA